MNVLVSGASGRMGKEIISCIEKDENLKFIAGFGQEANCIRKYTCL